MIIEDIKYRYSYGWNISGVFNVIDSQTNEYVEEPIMDNYYLFDIPWSNGVDNLYKRVVSLDALEIVKTDPEDDLSSYGFNLIRTDAAGYKTWAW